MLVVCLNPIIFSLSCVTQEKLILYVHTFMNTTTDHSSILIPLCAIGILLILSILVYGQFSAVNLRPGTIVLPGGVTYLGT